MTSGTPSSYGGLQRTPSSRPTVLLVDDDELFGEAVTTILAEANINTLVARNGRVGLQFFHAQPVDLVLLDIEMPELDGISTYRRLVQHNPEVTVIFVTGKPAAWIAEQLPPDANFAHLGKPIRAAQLLAAVTGMLD